MYRRYRRRPQPSQWPPPAGGRRYRSPYVDSPPRNRAAEIITISVLVAAFFLLGLGGMLWAVDARLALGPTPTPTPTTYPTRTPTPDFRSTQIVADFLTQRAVQLVQPPLAPGTATPAAVAVAPDVTPTAAADGPTPTPVSVLLPGVIAPGGPEAIAPGQETVTAEPTPEATAAQIEPPTPEDQTGLPTPTPPLNTLSVPMVVGGEPVTSTPTPEAPIPATPPPVPPTEPPPAPVEAPTATPTETPPVELPTLTTVPPTPSPIPSATDVPYLVNRLRAFVDSGGAPAYLGPSTIYTMTGTLAGDAEVNLIGRSGSGEWVYVCCLDNDPVWARQVDVRPKNNDLQPGAPEDADPNDVRWLSVQPAPSSIRTLPVPTPIPAGDYPLPYYTRAANGRIARLPNPPFSFSWPAAAQAGQALTSPPAVGGNSVLVGSADNHLYSFDRLNGNQRWRNDLGSVVRVSPIFYDGEFFVVDEAGLMRAFEDHGNGVTEIWNAQAGKPPLTSFNVYSDTLFLAVGQGAEHQLLAIDRDNGDRLHSFDVTGPGLRYPVIGEQLIYVADSSIWALDVLTMDIVWARSDIENITAGPIYVTPGVQGAAELYVVTGNNRIFCLDANTGDELWNFDNEEAATTLGLTDAALLVAGNGYLKAISRESVTQLWRVGVAGAVLGVPLSDAGRIMVLTQGGNVTYMDAASGSTLSTVSLPAPAAGWAAFSESWFFVPGQNGIMYALQGSP